MSKLRNMGSKWPSMALTEAVAGSAGVLPLATHSP